MQEEIKKYILSQSEIEAPALQKQFSISYCEARAIIDELEKDGKLQFKSGVVYSVNQPKPVETDNAPYKPQTDFEAKCIHALWVCIKAGAANVTVIQRRCCIGYAVASSIVGWMEKNNYATPFPDSKILITEAEYISKFGNPEDVNDNDDDDEYTDLSLYIRRRSSDLLSHAGIRREDKDEDKDNDDNDDNDDDKDDDDDDNDNCIAKVKSILIGSIVSSITRPPSGEYVIGIGDKLQFLFEYELASDSMRLSDGGTTMLLSPMTERRIKNALKQFPQVGIENGQLYITINNRHETFMAIMTLYAAAQFVLKRN